jgi:HEAT repeat protein
MILTLLLGSLALQDPKEAKEPWELAAAAFDKDFAAVEPPAKLGLIQELAKHDRPEIADRLAKAAVILDGAISGLLPEAEPKEIPVENAAGIRWILVWRDLAAKDKPVQEKILAIESVRAAAVAAMRGFSKPETLEWALAALQAHEHEAGREFVAHAFSAVAEPRINPALVAVLKKDKAASVLIASVESLAARKAREARDRLRALLASEDWRVRLAVILAVPQFADVQLTSLLVRALRDPRVALRLAALAGLQASGDRTLLASILPSLADESPKMRLAALRLVGEWGNRSILAWAAPLFADSDKEVRAAAVAAVAQAGGRKAIRPLAAALTLAHEDVRALASEAIVKLASRLAVAPLLAVYKEAVLAKETLARVTGVEKKNEREYEAWWDLEFRKAASDFDAQFKRSPPARRLEILGALAPHDRRESAERLVQAMLAVEDALQRLVPEKDKLLKEQATVAPTAGQRVWQAYYARQKALQAQLQELESIWNGAVDALSDLSDPEVMQWMAKRLSKSTYAWEREGLAQAMGGADPAVAVEPLVERVKKDKEWTVRVYAIDSLAALRDARAIDALVSALADEVWHVRLAAQLALEQIAGRRAGAPLIDALEKAEGRLAGEIQAALVRLTGVQSCSKPEDWKKWWGQNGDAFLSGQAREELPDTEIPADPKLPTFWGFTVTSKRVIFIVDVSGSMKEECEHLPDPDPAGKDKPEGKQKIQVARYELRQVVRMLSEDTLFNIISYSFGAQPWQPTLVPANAANKAQALTWVQGLPAAGGTNTFDSLDAAFQIKGPPQDKKRDQGADTFFFVSDGRPTAGRITDPAGILREIGRLNQVRRVRINTVAVGKDAKTAQGGDGVDPEFLKKLAEGNFGSSVWRK